METNNGVQRVIQSATILRAIYREDAVSGILLLDTLPICLTMERPWRNNQIGISCIPTGTFLCKRVNSPKFGDTFEVTGVSGRTEILLHKGNIDDDSHGCIILGENFDIWAPTGQLSIVSSKAAFDEFMKRTLGQNQFPLTVKEVR